MAAPRVTPLTEQHVDILSRYVRGEDVATIADQLRVRRDAVGDTLIRLCNLNRNAAREVLRYAPRAEATPPPARPLQPAIRARQQHTVKAPAARKPQGAAAKAAECPNADQHTPHPAGHVQHSDWADEMMKTHEQRQCAGCGLWAIWVPREPGPAVAPTEPAIELEPAPVAPTPVGPPSIVGPGVDLVVAYPVLVCRTCGFAGAVPDLHTECGAQAESGYCLIVTGDHP